MSHPGGGRLRAATALQESEHGKVQDRHAHNNPSYDGPYQLQPKRHQAWIFRASAAHPTAPTGVTELANAIAGTDASAMRRDAALQLSEAEFEYRRIEQYKLALLDAEIEHALKSVAMDDLSQEEIMRLQAQALSDPQGAWRVIRILNKLERYETPRWNQLCRALGRYAAVET